MANVTMMDRKNWSGQKNMTKIDGKDEGIGITKITSNV